MVRGRGVRAGISLSESEFPFAALAGAHAKAGLGTGTALWPGRRNGRAHPLDPTIRNGRPVVAGTRITGQTVLEFLGGGDEIADVLEDYPTLMREDVLACQRFSSWLMSNHFTLQGVA